jgi:hypothetical protein
VASTWQPSTEYPHAKPAPKKGPSRNATKAGNQGTTGTNASRFRPPTKQKSLKAWLWVLVAKTFTVFALRPSRKAAELFELWGKVRDGTLSRVVDSLKRC